MANNLKLNLMIFCPLSGGEGGHGGYGRNCKFQVIDWTDKRWCTDKPDRTSENEPLGHERVSRSSKVKTTNRPPTTLTSNYKSTGEAILVFSRSDVLNFSLKC